MTLILSGSPILLRRGVGRSAGSSSLFGSLPNLAAPTFSFDVNTTGQAIGATLTSLKSEDGLTTANATVTGPTVGQSTIDGSKVMRFVGGNDLNVVQAVNPNAFTMAFIMDTPSFAGGQANNLNMLAALGGVTVRNLYMNYSSALAFEAATKNAYSGLFNAGNFNIFIFTCQGTGATDLTLNANGIELADSSGFTATNQITNVRLGKSESGGQSLAGDMRGMAYWNFAMSPAQRAALFNTLRARLPIKKLTPANTGFLIHSNSLAEGIGDAGISSRILEVAMAGSSAPNKNNIIVRGYAGCNTTQLNTIRAASLDPHILGTGTNQYVIVWELTNSVASGQTGTATYALLKTYLTNLKAAFPNIKTIVMTMLPRGATAGWETERQTLNPLVLAGNSGLVNSIPNCYAKGGTDGIDYIYDVAGIVSIGAATAQTNLTNYLADQTHLTTAGTAIAAGGLTPLISFLAT